MTILYMLFYATNILLTDAFRLMTLHNRYKKLLYACSGGQKLEENVFELFSSKRFIILT